MSGFSRFVKLGLRDADDRVGAALTPGPLEPIDRYLRDSVIVAALDRAAERVTLWWMSSLVYERSASILSAMWSDRLRGYRAVASMLLIAVTTNVALTLLQGPRPGWFWMLIPSMATMLAALLFAGSRR